MIIDSHCHLTYEPMSSSLDETIRRANNDGVKYLLTISTEDKSFKNILEIVEKHNSVYGTYGIHPHEAKKHKEIKSNYIVTNVRKNKKIIGIGESGLDFYYNHSEKKDLKILIHCFTGTKEFAFKLLDIGAYISASGVVTFKKSKELAETFKEIPTNRILVETDSPYLAPEPLRGKPNEPSYITHTVRFLSDLKNISYEKFSDSTTQNFYNLFGKLN